MQLYNLCSCVFFDTSIINLFSLLRKTKYFPRENKILNKVLFLSKDRYMVPHHQILITHYNQHDYMFF